MFSKLTNEGSLRYLINLTGCPFHAASNVYACCHNMRRLPSICQTTGQSHTVKIYSHVYTVLVEAAKVEKSRVILDRISLLQTYKLLLTSVAAP